MSITVQEEDGVTGSNTHHSIIVASLVFLLVVINYADRGVIGVVGPALRKSFGLSIADFGIVASAFGWGYVLLVFLSGEIIRVLGVRRALYIFVAAWSATIVLMAVASSFGTLLAARVLFGAAEGAVFPIGSQLIAQYVDRSAQGRAAAVMNLGIPIGAIAIGPVAVWLTGWLGWRSAFICLGLIGFVWLLVWRLMADRGRSTNVSVEPIHSDPPQRPPSQEAFGGTRIYRTRALWFAGFAFFSSAYQLYFMLSFFPTYLIHERHISFAATGLLDTVPFIGMALGAAASGVISDAILRHTGSLWRARSLFAGVCLIATGFCVGLLFFAASITTVLVTVGVAGFLNFLANPMFFVIPIDMMPEHAARGASLTTGLGAAAAIVAPLLTGWLVNATDSFAVAFLVVMTLPILFGACLIIFVDPGKQPSEALVA